MTIAGAAQFLTADMGAMLLAVLLAAVVMKILRDDPVTHASVFQCGFRFNTYIGFAVCLRLFDEEGFALLALLIAFWVPISNTIAVGVLVKASGLTVPQTATTFLAHLGNDSLAMGLLCIGASLRLHDFRGHLALITTSVVRRLLAFPAIAWGVVTLAGLDPVEAGVAILFAALPTAQSCYVMTASMKGDAPSVANVTTAQTLAAMATLPFWISTVLIGLSPITG